MKKRKILSIMMMFLISSCNTNTNNINDLANQISSTFNGISKSFINSIINKYQIEKTI